jgi:diguanylate cyclase (GGDEF)-like protein
VATHVVFVVVGLLALSVVMIAVAATGHRAATRAHADLARTTRFDLLTGLPNRAQLEAELDTALAAGTGNAHGGLILVELTRYAGINDTYGHEVGDGLLVAAADQLGGALRSGERLFRPSGPQFAVFCPDLVDTGAATRRADELQAALAVPFRIGTDHLRVNTVSGIAMVDHRATGSEDLLRDGSVALQHAETDGPGSSVVFGLSMQATVMAAAGEKRLREALDNDEFELLYLPVVALDNQELVGVEALLRWADPERGLVSPSEFLPLLDESGLIVPVGDWAIEQACRQSVAWQQAFPARELITTVNVSPRQLASADFMERVLKTVEETGVEPGRLCLEITEGVVMRDIESSWTMLRKAKDAGIKLALDDFGTGFSSLGYLRRFNLDVLKIDRAFVRDVATSRTDAAIVQQLVALAHALDLAPVAEGVDSAEQAQTLHGMGCEFAQGFYFSAPQPVTAIDHLLAKGTVTPDDGTPSIDWTGAG